MLRPGILIDEPFIKKHASNQTVFDYIKVTDDETIQKFATLFKELKYLQFERDLRLKTREIVACFKATFESDTHFLSFALACYNEFCALNESDVRRMHETDVYLFRKSLYSAAFAVIIGLANDFYHYTMIKDFYNITLGLDLGICESHYSYYVAEGTNQENQNPGSGLAWMKSQGASEQEQKVFLEHPEKSYNFFEMNEMILAFPELKEIALYQHELSDGSGFPRGIPKGQVSSWEAVVILASSLVEIKDEYGFEQEVVKYIFNFQNKKLTDMPVQRVFQKFCMGLGDIYTMKESIG